MSLSYWQCLEQCSVGVLVESHWLRAAFCQILGCALQGGHNAMLEGACMTPGRRYTYTIFKDNGLIYSK